MSKGKTIDSVAEMIGSIITSSIYIDANQDGKIDWNEKLAFGMVIMNNVLTKFSEDTFKQLKEELANIDAEQIKSAIDSFSVTFDLEDEELETLIEKSLLLISNAVELAENWTDYKQKVQQNLKATGSLPSVNFQTIPVMAIK